MATLTINANDVDGVESIQVRYRVLNSGGTFVVVTLAPGDLPYVAEVPDNTQYEVGVQKLCTNGAYSGWISGASQPCASIVSFGVVESGSNFVVTATLAGTQTKIEVQVTDPNGGTAVVIHDFGTQSGTFNIASTLITGNYVFIARGVCNDTTTPRYVSAYTSPVTVAQA